MRVEAVLYVGDLARMQTFYTQCFGLASADSGPTYLGLTLGSWRLTLVQSRDALPTASPPPRRANSAVKLVFEVVSIDAVVPVITSLGGRFDSVDTRWEFRNTTHCDCLDPEGNVVQLIELLTPDA
jgi:predicted enzyme related to lactoylglutathione lyase